MTRSAPPISLTSFSSFTKTLRLALLAGTSLAVLSAIGAMAEDKIVADGEVSLNIIMNDSDTLHVQNGGKVATAGNAVEAAASATITITNNGSIQAEGNGIFLSNGSSMALVNTGTISAITGILGDGNATITSLLNDTDGIIRGDTGIRLDTGNLTNLTNKGKIEGLAGRAINVLNGTLSNLVNSGTIISGKETAVFALNIDGLVNLSGGLIASGTSNDSAISADGFLNNLTNEAGATIRGTRRAIGSGDEINNLKNAGLIEVNANTVLAVHGIFANGTMTNFANTGTINVVNKGTGDVNGIDAAEIFGFTNSGTINIASENGAAVRGIVADQIDNFHNSGTINVASAGGTFVYGIDGGHLGNITNSGNIFAGINSTAINENTGGDTNLTLLPGSVIEGAVDLGPDADIANLYVGNGLSAVVLFANQLDLIETYGAMMTTYGGANQVVIVADTSVLAAADNALSDTTGAISNVLDAQLEMNNDEIQQNWWLEGFGGLSRTDALAPTATVNHQFGGLMTGIDATVRSGLELGLFAGMSAGVLDVAVKNGQQVSSTSYFAGAYGQFDADAFYLNFGLTAGMSTNDSTRLVAHNYVEGGLHTADASFNSYFLSPEVTIGTETMNTGDIGFKPSLRLRYSFLKSDGYTEDFRGSGNDQGWLIVGDRASHVVDARVQFAMPVNNMGDDTMFELRAGVDGRLVAANSTFDATLNQQDFTAFDPGGAKSSVGGFVGADFSQNVSDAVTIFASSEFGISTETSFRVDAEAGLKVNF